MAAIRRKCEGYPSETVSEERPEEWVKRACAGDDEAFRRIFDRYGLPILQFLHHLVGQNDLAEDLTQETFVRAYLKMGELRNPSGLSTWLFGIARNVARESYRQRRRESSVDPLEEAGVLPCPGDSPDRALLQDELNQRIGEALKNLDEDRRLVFTLRVFHERSYEEIGEITGFSLTKLKSDLHRARVEMRRLLRPYLERSNDL